MKKVTSSNIELSSAEKIAVGVAIDLSEARNRQNMSYSTLASISGISEERIEDIETLRELITFEELIKISAALNLNVDINFTGVE